MFGDEEEEDTTEEEKTAKLESQRLERLLRADVDKNTTTKKPAQSNPVGFFQNKVNLGG